MNNQSFNFMKRGLLLMKLTCEQLINLTLKPRINDIDLNVLRQYYENYLEAYIFRYRIIGKDNYDKAIEVRFSKDKFCHLVGIESIVKYSVNSKTLKEYKGLKGWNNIESRDLTFDKLKRINKKRFKDKKDKMVFFYLIPLLLDKPKCIRFNRNMIQGSTNIDCELLFYDTCHNAYIHIGLQKSDDKKYYFPKSFFIEKITEKNTGKKFVQGQEKIYLQKVTKLNNI